MPDARERKILRVAVLGQLLVLVAMIALRAMPLLTGRTVLVRVQPVDPRDFFRGDYVNLSYEFSRGSVQGVEGLSQSDQIWGSKWAGRTVYVPLAPDSDRVHWRMQKMTVVKPASGLFLKGHTAGYGAVQFGIESYYVQEGTGYAYEQAIRDHKLSAELAVTSGGQAALRALRIE
jgi:uncharacterized membrane-anchored protein